MSMKKQSPFFAPRRDVWQQRRHRFVIWVWFWKSPASLLPQGAAAGSLCPLRLALLFRLRPIRREERETTAPIWLPRGRLCERWLFVPLGKCWRWRRRRRCCPLELCCPVATSWLMHELILGLSFHLLLSGERNNTQRACISGRTNICCDAPTASDRDEFTALNRHQLKRKQGMSSLVCFDALL